MDEECPICGNKSLLRQGDHMGCVECWKTWTIDEFKEGDISSHRNIECPVCRNKDLVILGEAVTSYTCQIYGFKGTAYECKDCGARFSVDDIDRDHLLTEVDLRILNKSQKTGLPILQKRGDDIDD